MSNYLIQGETLTNIANAIRTKTGKTDSIATENMATEISGLPIYPLYDGAYEEINFLYYNNGVNAYSVGGLGTVTATDIKLPDNYNGKIVNSIWVSAFRSTNITSVKGGNNLLEIGGSAFSTCVSLKSVIISDSVTSIGANAFDGCTNLETVKMGSNVQAIEASAFQKCSKLQSIEIPDTTTRRQGSVFSACTSLKSAKIGKGVKTLYYGLFWNCPLELIDFRSATSVPTLNSDVFNKLVTTCKIVVPDSLYNSWIVASNWTTYASKIVKASEYTEA